MGAYMRFIGDIAGTDVWIVDSEYNLITVGGSGMMGESYNYTDLPQNAGKIIDEVYLNKTVFSDEFSSLLSELTLTVGVPIKDSTGGIVGCVLLHSPVHGVTEAWGQGVLILLVSIILALAVSYVLSLWLSKRFTDPITAKEAADALRLEQIRRDFVANVSHELRTPVTVLRGSLEALCEKVVTDPIKVENYHSQMLNETRFLERLVGDLLDLSRLQNMDFMIEKTQISLCDVIADVVRSAERLAEIKGVHITVSHLGTGCQMTGDYGRLRQMFMIILDNAIKFSPDNGDVELSLYDTQVTIRDTGPGVEPQHLPFLFDRFYKARTEDNKTGTGLGLAIAKQIADRHEIRLTAQNAENSGAIFILDFSQNQKTKNTVLSKVIPIL